MSTPQSVPRGPKEALIRAACEYLTLVGERFSRVKVVMSDPCKRHSSLSVQGDCADLSGGPSPQEEFPAVPANPAEWSPAVCLSLTETDRAILCHLIERLRAGAPWATGRQIADVLKMPPTGVIVHHLYILKERGFLESGAQGYRVAPGALSPCGPCGTPPHAAAPGRLS